MLDKLARKPLPHERLLIGAKSLSLDPVWAQPPVADIEVALLRNAAFPELSRDNALAHEFVVVDPSTSHRSPSHEDLALRIGECASRLNIRTVVVGHEGTAGAGVRSNGGFKLSVHDLAALSQKDFPSALAALRDHVALVLSGARFSRTRHLFFPACDAALYTVVVDLLARMPAEERPFVHLASWWHGADLPNLSRFPAMEKIGAAVNLLNAERPTTFLYAWSRPLAQRMAADFGHPVSPLDAPPEMSLAAPGEPQPDHFTVGFFGAPTAQNGFESLAEIVRATNRGSKHPRRIRFAIQIRPDAPQAVPMEVLRAQQTELAAIPDRNVRLIEGALPRDASFAALKEVDAVLMPMRTTPGERYSATALHALAAGKLIVTFDKVSFTGAPRDRVLHAADVRSMGELISDTASDLAAVRAASDTARATWWAMQRPARLFAQLLYGPMILAGAAGAHAV